MNETAPEGLKTEEVKFKELSLNVAPLFRINSPPVTVIELIFEKVGAPRKVNLPLL